MGPPLPPPLPGTSQHQFSKSPVKKDSASEISTPNAASDKRHKGLHSKV